MIRYSCRRTKLKYCFQFDRYAGNLVTKGVHFDTLRYLRQTCKVEPKSKLLLCVSGGVDSMALLHIMGYLATHYSSCGEYIKDKSKRNKYNRYLDLSVVHFNHMQRSVEEATREKKLIEAICSDKNGYDIPLYVRNWNELKPDMNCENFQNKARIWRKNACIEIINNSSDTSSHALAKDALPSTSNYIVTAHHEMDHVETILMKLVRGTHISRLSPLKPVELLELGDSASRNPIHQLHPLLFCSKETLIRYMNENEYVWFEDASNNDLAYKRNKIRRQFIPLLTELCGSEDAVCKRITALGEQSGYLRDNLERKAKKYIEMQSKRFVYEPNDIRKAESESYHIIDQLCINIKSNKSDNESRTSQFLDESQFIEMDYLVQQEVIYAFLSHAYNIDTWRKNAADSINATSKITECDKFKSYRSQRKIITVALVDKILLFIKSNNLKKFIPFVGKKVLVLEMCKNKMLWLLMLKFK